MRSTSVLLMLASVLLSCSAAPRSAPPHGGQAPAGEDAAAKPPPRYARLDSALNAVLESERPLEVAAERGIRVREGHLQVTIVAVPDQVGELKSWLEVHGARNVSAASAEVQAEVTVDLLRALDRQPAVRAVRKPSAIRDPRLQEPVQGPH
jgi:hypothetical protein